jgi:hypothetical protein
MKEAQCPEKLEAMEGDFFDSLDDESNLRPENIRIGEKGNHRTPQETQEYLRTTPAFLNLLGMDIDNNPDRLRPVTGELRDRITELVGDDDIDIDAPLLPEDDESTSHKVRTY